MDIPTTTEKGNEFLFEDVWHQSILPWIQKHLLSIDPFVWLIIYNFCTTTLAATGFERTTNTDLFRYISHSIAAYGLFIFTFKWRHSKRHYQFLADFIIFVICTVHFPYDLTAAFAHSTLIDTSLMIGACSSTFSCVAHLVAVLRLFMPHLRENPSGRCIPVGMIISKILILILSCAGIISNPENTPQFIYVFIEYIGYDCCLFKMRALADNAMEAVHGEYEEIQ